MFGKTIIICLFAASVSGCATITRGTKDVLVVNSTPANAAVQLSTGHSCKGTPCSFKLPRRSEFEVEVTKPGCKPSTVRVTNKISGQGGAAMAGNVLVGGIVGAGIDAGTGAMHDLVPNPVEVNLECR